jgi:LPXTG-site transpeptidase (sortase) family protein
VQHFQRSVSKASKKVKKLFKKFFKWLNARPLLIVSFGLFIFFVGASHYYQIRILSFTKPITVAQNAQVGELPAQITIPSIGIDLPIDLGEIRDGVWQISYNNPTFLNTSARPGTGGNVVIYGHNKKIIFGNLPYLSLGQKIYIKTVDGKIHPYITYQKDFVGADRVDLVSPTETEELTVYTCWGLFDSRRAVIKARSAGT